LRYISSTVGFAPAQGTFVIVLHLFEILIHNTNPVIIATETSYQLANVLGGLEASRHQPLEHSVVLLNQIGLISASTPTSPHQPTEQTGGWLQGFCLSFGSRWNTRVFINKEAYGKDNDGKQPR
jgi:hypothetical protein